MKKRVLAPFLVLPFLLTPLFFLRSGVPDGREGAAMVLAHDKGSLPRFQEAFEIQARASRSSTGLFFAPQPSRTTDLFISRMQAHLPTPKAPDLFTWWSGDRVRDLVEKDLVLDLTDLWDRHASHYPEAIRAAHTLDGRVYGFPYSIEYWPVWYNRQIFKRLGLTPPRTWDDFMTLCEKLKREGIPPLLSSLQLSWYATIWFSQLLLTENPAFYTALCAGKASYGDPQVRKALTIWKDMLEKGYFTPPATRMFTNGGHLWREEAFAMVLCGSWYPSGVLMDQGVDKTQIGVFLLPSRHPETPPELMMESGSLFIASQAPRSREARILADWWMGTQGSLLFSRSLDTFSANRSVPTDHLPAFRQELLTRIREKTPGIHARFWEAAPGPLLQPVTDILAGFILQPDTLETTLEALAALPETRSRD